MNIICFSHIRWNEDFKRPQEFMRLLALTYNVYYIESAVINSVEDGYYVKDTDSGVIDIIPHLNITIGHEDHRLQNILFDVVQDFKIRDYIFWYYTPFAKSYSYDFLPYLVVYDCMEESSLLRYNIQYLENERSLLGSADIIFTGGRRQYDYMKNFYNNVHCVPGSFDKLHFHQARKALAQPYDQADIPHPRLGYFGAIDERLDMELITAGADARPDWHFVIIGPVVKIDHQHLPIRENIHYLGVKPYEEIPQYLSGWDIALIPYVINESTRFMNPTKTSEYLASGTPIISTRIADIVDPYGEKGLVNIIYNAAELIDVAEIELNNISKERWLSKVDEHLIENSWEDACSKVSGIIEDALMIKNYDGKVEQKICV